MMKRFFCAAGILAAFILLTAMGGKGAGFERAPRVEKNYAVTVTDITGNKINGDRFSWEGRVHFAGSIGMANVNIPFEKIRELTVGEKREKKMKVTATLREGGETVFEVDADSRCYGEAPFGSFMLTMDEIKAIAFK